MKETSRRTILVVDDDIDWHKEFRLRFGNYEQRSDCLHRFRVETATSATSCIRKIRHRSYDAIILDIRMEERLAGIWAASALAKELGKEKPVRVVFTGYPEYETCVQAMRSGAWDYIIKKDYGDRPAAQVVVESIVNRFRQLDLEEELLDRIGREWLPANLPDLTARYPGMLVAIWYDPASDPEVQVVKSGRDAIELETRLAAWRRSHAEWQHPFIVRIPGPTVKAGR